MTQPANAPSLALYLGESYATARLFDAAATTETIKATATKTTKKTTAKKSSTASTLHFEKSVFLPQVSLKSFLNQIKTAAGENGVKSVYVVTSYMDRLKPFRLGGSVVQVVAEGFENSYSAGHTQYLSLAAPSLIVSVNEKTDADFLTKELARLKKINSEINKVVFQLPEHLVPKETRDLITEFFTNEEFNIFETENPTDLEEIRLTLLNAGSEGTKDEILSEISEAFGEETAIKFWIKDCFTDAFDNIDLYWSSSFFLKDYLLKNKKTDEAFYFDLEKWAHVSEKTAPIWISPWGPIRYEHPIFEKFEVDPFSELTLNKVGQLIVSENNPQHEPGPFIAGRSMKALVLDAFYDELKENPKACEIFGQINAPALLQKLENHFSILEKGQTLEATLLTREELKNWIRAKLLGWMHLRSVNNNCTVFGDLSFLVEANRSILFSLNILPFNWADAMTDAIKQQGAI